MTARATAGSFNGRAYHKSMKGCLDSTVRGSVQHSFLHQLDKDESPIYQFLFNLYAVLGQCPPSSSFFLLSSSTAPSSSSSSSSSFSASWFVLPSSPLLRRLLLITYYYCYSSSWSCPSSDSLLCCSCVPRSRP